jgi:hypothetical protein
VSSVVDSGVCQLGGRRRPAEVCLPGAGRFTEEPRWVQSFRYYSCYYPHYVLLLLVPLPSVVQGSYHALNMGILDT